MRKFNPLFFAASVGAKLAGGMPLGQALIHAADRYDRDCDDYDTVRFGCVDDYGNQTEKGKTLFEFFAPNIADHATAEYRAAINEPDQKIVEVLNAIVNTDISDFVHVDVNLNDNTCFGLVPGWEKHFNLLAVKEIASEQMNNRTKFKIVLHDKIEAAKLLTKLLNEGN